jgi:hypothetical protein
MLSRSFLRSANFWLQNDAILRNAAQIGFVLSTYEKQAVQRCENIRNSLGLNYKSAALPAELCRRSHTKAVFSELIKRSSHERINAGLAAAGVRLGRWSTLDRHVKSVAKLSRKGLSERRIAAELCIPAGSVFAILKRTRNDSIR